MTLNALTPDMLSPLRAQLPDRVFRPVEPQYLQEPRGRWQGQAGAVLAPENTEQTAQIMRFAHQARVPVVPYGGGTGLVGGQVMPDGPAPLVLSLQNMTRLRAIYPQENLMIAEAGAILQDLHDAAAQVDRLFPLYIAAKGTAQIGGNLSTNAGGVNVLRYGNARDLCLGIEAVLPDGRVLNGLKRLHKDNTGYDLRNLMIGAEGTLGVITAATLKLFPKTVSENTALFVVRDPVAALDLLSLARRHLGNGINAFELIHRQGLEFLAETMPDLRQPFSQPPEWLVLVDIGMGPGQDPVDLLENLFLNAHKAGLVDDGLVAQNQAQRDAFWAVRESIPEANKRIGAISSHDVSLPLGNIAPFLQAAGPALARQGDFRVNCFGHLGDGNLHYNVFPAGGKTRADYSGQASTIKRLVHDLVDQFDGSVSAEHGIGRLKATDLQRYGDPVKLQMMQAIKQALDPQGIMNPGAMLPPTGQ